MAQPARTVYRDKSGRRIDLAVEAAKRKEEERVKMEEDDKFADWGRGYVIDRFVISSSDVMFALVLMV